MSSVDKLSIRGIRSFSPSRDEVIEFFYPLTVIVGANGCGKTTIIECLKCSCTGSLPPDARSGQSWIHDPKIAGDAEVKACVRLRYRNRAGQPMVVQRSFQLEQLKTTCRFKALDGVIRTIDKNGDHVSYSHKCGELDKHIPESMGVSKAILENVIFCHQEESNWPLQEGAVLKKKFDDIFESSRYTKALECIRKIKKEKLDLSKDYKRDLTILHSKVIQVNEITDGISLIQEKLNQQDKQTGNMEQEISSLEDKTLELNMSIDEVKGMQVKIDRCLDRISEKESTARRVYESIEQVMTDSDDELKNLLNDYEAIISEHARELNKKEDQMSALETRSICQQEQYASLCVQQGKLQGAIESQKKLGRRRDEFMQKCGLEYAIGTYNSPISDNDIRNFTKKFKEVLERREKALLDLNNESSTEEDKFSNELSELQAQLHHCNEGIKAGQVDISEIEKSLLEASEKIRSQGRSGAVSQHEVTDTKRRIADIESRLEDHKKQFDITKMKAVIKDMNKQISDLSFETDSLEEKAKVLRLNERERISLENRRQEYIKRQNELEEKFNERVEDLSKYLAHTPTLNNIDQDSSILENIAGNLKNRRCELAMILKEKENILSELEASTKHIERELATLQSEKTCLEEDMEKIKALMSDVLPGESLEMVPDALSKLENFYFEAKEKTSRRKGTIGFLSTYKKKGEQEKCCPLCTRSMTSEELVAFTSAIDDKTDDSRVKEKIKKAEEREASALQSWKNLESKMTLFNKWKFLSSKIPEKLNELEKMSLERFEIKELVESKKYDLESIQDDEEFIFELCRYISNIRELYYDQKRNLSRMEDDENRLATINCEYFGSDRPVLQKVEEEKNEKISKIQELNRLLQKKQSEVQTSQEVQQQLQTDLHRSQQEKLLLEKMRNEYEATKSSYEALQIKLKIVKEKVLEMEKLAPCIQRDINSKTSQRQSFRQQARLEKNSAQDEYSKMKEDYRNFESINNNIISEMQGNRNKDLEAVEAKLIDSKRNQNDTKWESEELTKEINAISHNLEQQESFKRHIKSNLEYRFLKSELASQQLHLKKINAHLASLPSINELMMEIETTNNNLRKLRDDRATSDGKKQQLNEQLHEMKVKLHGDELRNIEEKHRLKLIDFEITNMAVSDLEKYYKALDQALLEYHSRKIVEINAIIKEFWQLAYRGQDIDTIELVSGQDKSARSGRSYNYRVMMRKGDGNIDMRGRCSAGQKVLASLVIRLALAETFCLNCGILALDEPTTNLDTENKIGLAQAICEIINARSSQRNFQIICITHDETFVRMLGRTHLVGGSNPGYYWRISREELSPNQFYSKIERQDWDEE